MSILRCKGGWQVAARPSRVEEDNLLNVVSESSDPESMNSRSQSNAAESVQCDGWSEWRHEQGGAPMPADLPHKQVQGWNDARTPWSLVYRLSKIPYLLGKPAKLILLKFVEDAKHALLKYDLKHDRIMKTAIQLLIPNEADKFVCTSGKIIEDQRKSLLPSLLEAEAAQIQQACDPASVAATNSGIQVAEVLRIIKLKMDLFAIKLWAEQLQHPEAHHSYEVQVHKDILQRVKEHADRMLFDNRGPEGETLAHMLLLHWSKQDPRFSTDWEKTDKDTLPFLREGAQIPLVMQVLLWMVHQYGSDVVNCPFQLRHIYNEPGVYEGETLLHMAVARQDLGLVKYLVGKNADLYSRAWGSFFQSKHFGELPLLFAVYTGNEDIVEYLLKAVAGKELRNTQDVDVDDVDNVLRVQERVLNFSTDAFGEMALHICVRQKNFEMYKLLVETFNVSELCLNNDRLTPLTLCTRLGHAQMFTDIVNRRRDMRWEFADTVCFQSVMTEHETIRPPYSAPSTLEVIVKHDQGIMFVACGLLTKVLKEKYRIYTVAFWTLLSFFFLSYVVFGMAILENSHLDGIRNSCQLAMMVLSFFWLAFLILYGLAQSIHIVSRLEPKIKHKSREMTHIWKKPPDSAYQAGEKTVGNGTTKQDADTQSSTAKRASWGTSLKWLHGLDSNKGIAAATQGISMFFECFYYAMISNGIWLLWMFTATSFFSCYFSYTSGETIPSFTERRAYTSSVAFLSGGYFFIVFFMTGITTGSIGLYIIVLRQCIRKVIVPLLFVFLALMIPHANALMTLFISDEDVPEEFQSQRWSFGKLFTMSQGGVEFDDFSMAQDSVSTYLASPQMVLYAVIMFTLLMNLVIAELSDVIAQVKQEADAQVRQKQATNILWMEKMSKLFFSEQTLTAFQKKGNTSSDVLKFSLEESLQALGIKYRRFLITITIHNIKTETKIDYSMIQKLRRLVLDACLKPTNRKYMCSKCHSIGDPPLKSDPDGNLATVASDQLVAELNGKQTVPDEEHLLLLSYNEMRTTHSTWKKAVTRMLCARQISSSQHTNSKSMNTTKNIVHEPEKDAPEKDAPEKVVVINDLWRNACIVRGQHHLPKLDHSTACLSLRLYLPSRRSQMTRIIYSTWNKLWRTNKTAPSKDDEVKGVPKKLLEGVSHANKVAGFLQSQDFEKELIRYLELKPQNPNSCSVVVDLLEETDRADLSVDMVTAACD